MSNRSSLVAHDGSQTVAMLQLRDLTTRFGVIHEFQALQLKIWPRLVLPHTTESVAKLNVEQCRVDFHIKTKGKAPTQMKQRLAGLNDSVKLLLGDWWEVRVIRGGKSLYVGKRLKKMPQKKEFLGTDYEAGRIVPDKPWQYLKTPPSSK